MTTLAVMQPYFFPYIGYWQLIHAADKFVVYDDVNFIVRGWINRNRILINGQPSYITVPLDQASQNKLICEVSTQLLTPWREKIIKTISITYRNSPYFYEVFPFIENLIQFKAENLSDYLVNQLQKLAAFIGITTEFVLTSTPYKNRGLTGQTRILDICSREKADIYINPVGGQKLYNKQGFDRLNIDLKFISMRPIPYIQKSHEFHAHLSIVDALMELGPIKIKHHLDAFDLT